MLYNLIKKLRGKEQIVMTDSLAKVNNRMKTLRGSYRGRNDIEIYFEEADETAEKFKKKPAPGSYRGGDYAQFPRRVK